MKKLPFFKRPFLARRVLEIGGGHDPYFGVTHAVDKFPADNSQRAGSMVLGRGVEFKTGDLEAIPFGSEPKFDFLYASHVLEHVHSPEKAISEINRLADRGYIETPSPLREHLCGFYPFDRDHDIHHFFFWVCPEDPNTIHFIRKSEKTLAHFCDCPFGELAKKLFRMQRLEGVPVEPLIPGVAKKTALYFRSGVRLIEHESFTQACRTGRCAFAGAKSVWHYSNLFWSLVSKRFRQLRRSLAQG